MSSKWTRPKNVPFPSVWKRFKGRKELYGVIPEFWIQDIPEEEFENAVNFMMSGFPYDEPLNKYSNLKDDTESMKVLRKLLTEVVQQKLGLICYTNNPDPNGNPIIAGVNCTYPKTKSDLQVQIAGKIMLKIFATMDTVSNLVDAHQILNADVVLNAMGLYVDPIFRGQNLGLEILKAREDICKAVGIKAAVTVFTATASQVIAVKAGYRVLSEIPYNKLTDYNPNLVYPGIEEHTQAIKFMCKEF